MTILAGAFSRVSDVPLSDALCDRISTAVSRDPRAARTRFRDNRCLLVQVDLGVYGEPGQARSPDGSLTFVVGDPLLWSRHRLDARHVDVLTLHDRWCAGDWRAQCDATGVFAAAHYCPAEGTLTVVTDKLGIRPVYYWLDDALFVFATSLRVLQATTEVPKELDLRGVTEQAVLGYPLGDRTPFRGLRRLRAGELTRVTASSAGNETYWRWDRVRPATLEQDEAVRTVHRLFTDGIVRRSGADRTAHAFLSGGLDSRTIVAVLRDMGLCVHTVNLSLPSSRDQIFAAGYAAAVGTVHEEAPFEPEQSWSTLVGRVLQRNTVIAERPSLVWSGDGGSVGLGHVYVEPEMVRLLRQGVAAPARYIRDGGVRIPRVVQRGLCERLGLSLTEAIDEGLSGLECEDRGRALHLFLMLTDQHRHMDRHFEEIDLHGLEFHLPFFDSRFLEFVLSAPLDWFLGHRFYMRFLESLPHSTVAVPWQTYPGHEVCPLPVPEELGYQWSAATQRSLRRRLWVAMLRDGARLAFGRTLPRTILRPWVLRGAWIAHLAGLGSYDYLLEAAAVYARYAAQCSRTESWSSLPFDSSSQQF